MTATKVSGHPRWNALPEGPLLRMFEVMALQDDGQHRVIERATVSSVAAPWHELEQTLLAVSRRGQLFKLSLSYHS